MPMSIENFTTSEKKAAWNILDAFQNEMPTNMSLSLKKILERFDLIQELKDRIDVRETEEKLSTESLLPHLEGKEKTECESMQQFQNRLCRIFSFQEQQMVNPIKR